MCSLVKRTLLSALFSTLPLSFSSAAESSISSFLSFDPVSDSSGAQKESRLVFAHYFPAYSQMMNNMSPGEDYYDLHYLNPYGENSKFLNKGGLLRERPIARVPYNVSGTEWGTADAEFEVRQAAAIGLDGFTVNILSNTGGTWTRAMRIVEAAEKLGNFKIVIMPDMNAQFHPNKEPEAFIPTIRELSKSPAAFRLKDGRLVVAPYLAENFSPTWWKQTLDQLKAEGINVALMPLYQGWVSDLQQFKQQEPEAFQEYVIGVSDWGLRTPSGALNLLDDAGQAHDEGVWWMAPVAPQDARPKRSNFTEAGNSEAYRTLWESAINGGADWVQVITWNDYSESTQITPSTQTGYAFYDLTAYYIDWFKNQQQPEIKRDAMYAFYREHSTDTPLSGYVQSDSVNVVNGEAPRNEIELLAFLTTPATLAIEIDGTTYEQYADAGMTSFKIPLQEGRPVFRILRDNKVIQEMVGKTSINIHDAEDVLDLTYWGMSSLRHAEVQNQQYLSWPRKTNSAGRSSVELANSQSPFPRKSNALPDQLTFIAGQGENGFTYEFLPVSVDSATVISFDINLESRCIGRSTLVAKLTDGDKNSGIEIELCNNDKSSSELQNRTVNGDQAIPNSHMNSDQWYNIRIIVNPANSYTEKYEISVTKEDGTSVGYSNVVAKAKVQEISSLQFELESNARFNVPVKVDNFTVTSANQSL
ncbi:hypothetical protein DXV75_04015 [Alteromonas aestuariivivens]|uniref:Glycosyl hydrolase family 71 n=1 Tax=Alteromonas aestuariivivens TaxID=1938339 RepID=A0A3D8MCB4_9ALTE|nr:glycoside hydrolase family 71 protein [Alteromonas aestuariivivens]RDV28136.1 hypothetical protein DXV75_04015 [Alteromonas aestuariivivens]